LTSKKKLFIKTDVTERSFDPEMSDDDMPPFTVRTKKDAVSAVDNAQMIEDGGLRKSIAHVVPAIL
jgi:hypothetical protein